MSINTILSTDQIQRAIVIAEQIQNLEAELNQILGGSVTTSQSSSAEIESPKDGRKGKRSAAQKARMAAAQKLRWATRKTTKAPTADAIEKIAKIEAKAPKPEKAGPGKSIPLSELKELLAVAPEKTLNIRKAGLQLRNIKVLAGANPHLLKLGGKNPWPTVTMLK
jgi:hypothetical protein